ncbi:hypothetical protein [Phytohabitans rumicis]|uniref:hypothetical protein n=1 Tax=Phytohabitans rumicis TaxID=1076125 RepID=UPI0031F17D26
MNDERTMAGIEPGGPNHEEAPAAIPLAPDDVDAAAVAGLLATADRRGADAAYIAYLTALNELTSPVPAMQNEGVARMGRLCGDVEHGEAAIAVLESLVAEAGARPEAFTPLAVLLAREILVCHRPVQAPAAQPTPPSARSAPAPSPRQPGRRARPAPFTARLRVEAYGMVRHALEGGRWWFAAALAATVVAGAAPVVWAVGLGEVARDPGTAPSAGIGLVIAAVGGILVLGVLRGAGIYTARVATERAQISLAAADRTAAVHAYLRRPQQWADGHFSEQALAVVRGDRERLWYPVTALPFVLGTAVVAIGAVAVMLLIDWVVGAAGAAVLAVIVTVSLLYLYRLTRPSRRIGTLATGVRAAAAESVDWAAAGAAGEGRAGRRFATASSALCDERVRLDALRTRFTQVLDLLPVLGTISVVPLAMWRAGDGDGGAVAVVTAAFLFMGLALPIRAAAWLLGELPASVVRWHRVQRRNRHTGGMAYGSVTLPAGGPGKLGTLRFEDVGLDAPGGRTLLTGLNFTVPPGRTVAICGADTELGIAITSLAGRLVDPTSGAVMLDGADLRELTEESLAARITWVTADLDQVRRAIRAVRDGPHLIVVDDTYRPLPAAQEAAIAAELRAAPYVSALVVTNRRAVLALADEVVHLDGGCVAARGPHDWLLEHVPGYAAVVSIAEGDREPSAVDGPTCADTAATEATERHHCVDRLALLAAAPRAYAVLRRGGTTCHACRTTIRRAPRPPRSGPGKPGVGAITLPEADRQEVAA